MEGAWVRPRSMGATVSWRALLLAALTSALIALAVILAPGGPAVGRPSPTRSFGHAQALAHSAAVSSLPLAAQAQISGELAASTAAFRAIPSGDGFQTANRAQGLTASFDRSGVAIAAGSVSLQMSVRAIGSDSSSLPLGQSAPTAHGNRVSYARPQLGEWYRNGPMGIEQGFTISRSPAGADSGPLTLTMSLSGNARATLSRDARSIRAPTRVRSGPARPPSTRNGLWSMCRSAHRARPRCRLPAGRVSYPQRFRRMRVRRYATTRRPTARTGLVLARRARPRGRPARSDGGRKPRVRVQRQLPHPCSVAWARSDRECWGVAAAAWPLR